MLTEAEIDRDRAAAGALDCFDLRYEDFCAHPVAMLEGFAGFYGDGARGAALKRRHSIPTRFQSSRPRELPPAEVEAIRRHLGRLTEIGRAACRERVCQYV